VSERLSLYLGVVGIYLERKKQRSYLISSLIVESNELGRNVSMDVDVYLAGHAVIIMLMDQVS
jgi:hypothetical protein